MGGPGAGKTTLLQAIGAVNEAIGSYGGPQSPARLRRAGASRARVDVVWALSVAERVGTDLESSDLAATWTIGDWDSRVDYDPRPRRLFTAYSHASEQGKLETCLRIDGSTGRAPEFAAEGSSKLRFKPELAATRGARQHEIER